MVWFEVNVGVESEFEAFFKVVLVDSATVSSVVRAIEGDATEVVV